MMLIVVMLYASSQAESIALAPVEGSSEQSCAGLGSAEVCCEADEEFPLLLPFFLLDARDGAETPFCTCSRLRFPCFDLDCDGTAVFGESVLAMMVSAGLLSRERMLSKISTRYQSLRG